MLPSIEKKKNVQNKDYYDNLDAQQDIINQMLELENLNHDPNEKRLDPNKKKSGKLNTTYQHLLHGD